MVVVVVQEKLEPSLSRLRKNLIKNNCNYRFLVCFQLVSLVGEKHASRKCSVVYKLWLTFLSPLATEKFMFTQYSFNRSLALEAQENEQRHPICGEVRRPEFPSCVRVVSER